MEKKKGRKWIIQPQPPTTIAPFATDPFGSYTGLVLDLDDQPVQDADDL